MKFDLIDLSTWERKEHFDIFFNKAPCSYSMTANLDITHLLAVIKKKEIKLYPTTIYLLSSVVNRLKEFRFALDENGKVGVFDILHPSFTIFHKDSKTFSQIWTEYKYSFQEFYQHYLRDLQAFGSVKKFNAKPNEPKNLFTVSSIPWVSFTGFNLNLPKDTDYLLPIFTMGKYFEQNDRMWLPLSIQVHHAVCDGYHVAQFIEELQSLMNTFEATN